MGGRSKSGKGNVELPFYHLSFHAGICYYGTGIQILSAYAGDKKFYEGTGSTISSVSIDKSDLFGGNDREGGLKGLMHILPGAITQLLPASLAARLNATPTTTLGYRGIFSVWFTGESDPKGFMLGANNPYMKPFKFRMRRPSQGLNPTYQFIRLPKNREKDDPDQAEGYVQYASNPSHVLYEIYTNSAWGEGRDPITINKSSFEAAAEVLYNEKFGISFAWYRQTEIQKIVQEIIDHVQCSIYDDPETGLLTIKLLRHDYNPSTLPSINPGNAKLTHFKRKLWGEVSAEVVVTWTNPENESEMTITAHNLAVSQAQVGSVVSTSRNYYMIRDERLAARLAERDLASLSYPLAACDAEVHRSFGKVVPGDVLNLSWPEFNIDTMPMRVMEVLPGSSDSAKLTLKLQEDIFGIGATTYLGEEDDLRSGSRIVPENTPARLGTLPAYMTAAISGMTTVSDLKYPTARVGILMEQPHPAYDVFNVYGPRITALGSQVQMLGSNPYPTTATIAEPLSYLTPTVVIRDIVGDRIRAGQFVFIGALNSSGEIALVTAYNEATNTLTLRRGCLDTIPHAWNADEKIIIVPNNFDRITDNTERSDGESITLQLQTRASGITQKQSEAASYKITLNDRAHLPLRPANMRVNGVGLGQSAPLGTGAITVTWANRNRITESQIVLDWHDATVAPEPNQLTNVIVRNLGGGTVVRYNNIAGTQFTIPRSAISAMNAFTIRLQSTRNDSDEIFTSFTTPEILVSSV